MNFRFDPEEKKRFWRFFWIFSTLFVGWPIIFALAYLHSWCDPALAFVGCVFILPIFLVFIPLSWLAGAGALALSIGSAVAATRLIRRIPTWLTVAAIVSTPIVYAVSMLLLAASGVHPLPGRCVI